MTASFVYTAVGVEYDSAVGAARFTVIVIVAVVDPPELDAVMRYGITVCSVSGVPVIEPVVVLSISPFGSVGVTDHEVTVPVTVGILGVMTASFV
jgi:hypothetical protein